MTRSINAPMVVTLPELHLADWRPTDPELESIKIYRRNDAGRYERVVEVSTETEGATISSPLFPDLEIPLVEVFAEGGELTYRPAAVEEPGDALLIH